MKDYFLLQFTLITRSIKDLGINPFIGSLIYLAGFVGISSFLFYKTAFAGYAYILISLALTAKLSESNRINFLKLCFKDNDLKRIRIIENSIVSLPFLIVLVYNHQFIGAIFLLICSIVFVFSSFNTPVNWTIPTPFSKKPFEFIVGFRNTFFVYPMVYLLTFIAIAFDNFNLGIFSLLLIFFITLGFYLKPENDYLVWSFALTPKQFMLSKLKTGLVFASVLSFPILVALSIFYYEECGLIITFYLIGCLSLITIISAKYAAFPNEINFVEGFIILNCMSFPPLLLLLAPYFYFKATHTLQHYLV